MICKGWYAIKPNSSTNPTNQPIIVINIIINHTQKMMVWFGFFV